METPNEPCSNGRGLKLNSITFPQRFELFANLELSEEQIGMLKRLEGAGIIKNHDNIEYFANLKLSEEQIRRLERIKSLERLEGNRIKITSSNIYYLACHIDLSTDQLIKISELSVLKIIVTEKNINYLLRLNRNGIYNLGQCMSYDRVWGFNLWDILVNNYFVKDELLNIIDIINEKQIELPDANTRGIYFYIYVAKREPKLIRVFSDIIVKHNFMYRFCVNFVRDDLELLVHVPSEIKTENFYKEAILMSSEFPKSFLNLIPDEIKTKDFYSRLCCSKPELIKYIPGNIQNQAINSALYSLQLSEDDFISQEIPKIISNLPKNFILNIEESSVCTELIGSYPSLLRFLPKEERTDERYLVALNSNNLGPKSLESIKGIIPTDLYNRWYLEMKETAVENGNHLLLNPSDWTDNVVYDYLKRHPESFYKIPLDKRTPKNFVYAILKEIWQCGVLYPQERTGQKQDLSEYIQNQLNKMSEGININDYFMDVLKESSIYPDELNILKEIFIELKLIDPKSIKEESVEDKTQINEIVSDLRRFHILDLDDYLPEYRKKIISRYPSILNVAGRLWNMKPNQSVYMVMHSENFEQLKNGLNLISLMTDKDCVSKFLKFYPDILDVYEKSRIKPQKFFTRLVSTETIEDLRKSVRLKNK